MRLGRSALNISHYDNLTHARHIRGAAAEVVVIISVEGKGQGVRTPPQRPYDPLQSCVSF